MRLEAGCALHCIALLASIQGAVNGSGIYSEAVAKHGISPATTDRRSTRPPGYWRSSVDPSESSSRWSRDISTFFSINPYSVQIESACLTFFFHVETTFFELPRTIYCHSGL